MPDHDHDAGVLLALHGHGDAPDSALRWGRRLAPPGWEVVAPEASAGPAGAGSWFDTGARGADPLQLGAAVDHVAALARQARGLGRQVVVAGFSQGGAVALELAARNVDCDGIVAVCAFLAESDEADALRTWAGRAPVLVVAGGRDDHVPAFLGQDAASLLSSHGRRVEFEELDGGHEVGDGVVAVVRSWWSRTLEADGA